MYDQLFRVTLFAVALIASTVTHGAGLIISDTGCRRNHRDSEI